MSETELRAVAERLDKDHATCDPHLWNAHRQCQWCKQDRDDVEASMLARAWLAERDETPVDETWLRSVGFVTCYNDWWIQSPTHESIRVCYCFKSIPVQWAIVRDDYETPQFELPLLKTRGDVRRLCSALGIKLESRP